MATLVAVLMILLCWAAVVALLRSSTETMLFQRVLYWMPASVRDLYGDNLRAYSRSALIGTRVASLLVVGVIEVLGRR